MNLRRLLATVFVILLLLLTLLGGHVEARPAPRSPPRRHLWTGDEPESSADGYHNTRHYAHRKLGEKSKTPKNSTKGGGIQFDVGSFGATGDGETDDIKLLNAPQIHLWVEFSSDVTLSRLTINSPGDSPENDGIHVAHSDGVRILGAKIKAGDDCLSVALGTSNLYATKIECGPGHGISIGSLGKGTTKAEVSNVTVDGAHVSGTLFGARIKTWQGGTGYARDIKFQNMVMDKVKNPIVIDQNYCTTSDPSKPKACGSKQESAVEITNVEFSNIRGTSVNRDAIRLHCSEAFPCRGVVLKDIDLKTKGGGEKNAATSTCENAVLGETSNVSPAPCSSAATKEDLVPLGSEDGDV
ncbi:unnamed protein product [Urochloa decumbens]|uniref:Polygalacturonase n=1 Tax=Urochloa decumbens TaxID=240449 RepID=A0ABC9G1U2_9POAL